MNMMVVFNENSCLDQMKWDDYLCVTDDIILNRKIKQPELYADVINDKLAVINDILQPAILHLFFIMPGMIAMLKTIFVKYQIVQHLNHFSQV